MPCFFFRVDKIAFSQVGKGIHVGATYLVVNNIVTGYFLIAVIAKKKLVNSARHLIKINRSLLSDIWTTLPTFPTCPAFFTKTGLRIWSNSCLFVVGLVAQAM